MSTLVLEINAYIQTGFIILTFILILYSNLKIIRQNDTIISLEQKHVETSESVERRKKNDDSDDIVYRKY